MPPIAYRNSPHAREEIFITSAGLIYYIRETHKEKSLRLITKDESERMIKEWESIPDPDSTRTSGENLGTDVVDNS